MGRTVTDVVIDKLIKDIEESNILPWQQPYKRYNAFNYFTCKPYRGINRLILPFGEYLTANQINEYNKKHNEDYRFKKGIRWYPVVFYKFDEYDVSLEEVQKLFPNYSDEREYIGYKKGYHYVKRDSRYIKYRSTLRYYNVADRNWFVNSRGEVLPSRLDTGEVQIEVSNANKVISDYLEREGIQVIETLDVPCWGINNDIIKMNNHMKDSESWYSTMFHEMAHSTGHPTRLNREGCSDYDQNSREGKIIYAKEECIAEITAYLCCSECGVYTFETSGTNAYENNIAYVQYWKRFIKENGKDFLKIVSKADSAFEYIMNFEE